MGPRTTTSVYRNVRSRETWPRGKGNVTRSVETRKVQPAAKGYQQRQKLESWKGQVC